MKKRYLICLFFSLTISAQQKIEVFFDFDKYDLNDAAVETLNGAIANRKNIEVSKIYGFCDWKGTNSYNDTLSLKRVNEVWYFLKNKGIRIREDYEKRGFGEDFEQSKVQSENRKVMIVFEETKIEMPIRTADDRILSEKIKTAKRGDKIKLQNINFHNNSAVIVPKSKPVLYDLLCVMEDNPKLKIEIQGHICCQPERDVNDVSTARARAIYMFLIRNKIDRKRLSFKGFGISEPIYPIPEKSESEADENRRVEIMIVEN
jgi:outer membrane protein OmpA-like peptidoglycan-associated protein